MIAMQTGAYVVVVLCLGVDSDTNLCLGVGDMHIRSCVSFCGRLAFLMTMPALGCYLCGDRIGGSPLKKLSPRAFDVCLIKPMAGQCVAILLR